MTDFCDEMITPTITFLNDVGPQNMTVDSGSSVLCRFSSILCSEGPQNKSWTLRVMLWPKTPNTRRTKTIDKLSLPHCSISSWQLIHHSHRKACQLEVTIHTSFNRTRILIGKRLCPPPQVSWGEPHIQTHPSHSETVTWSSKLITNSSMRKISSPWNHVRWWPQSSTWIKFVSTSWL